MKIANCFSAALPTSRNVPQGVSLSTLRHNLDHQMYTNRSQTYAILATRDTNHFQNCLHKIFHWMTETTLKLNASKSEFVVIGGVNFALHVYLNGLGVHNMLQDVS